MKKIKNRSKEGSPVKAIPILIGINIGVFLLLSLIACVLLYCTEDPTGNISLYSMISLVTSGAVGSLIGAKAASARVSFVSSVICVGIYLSIALITGGSASGRALMNAICYIISSALLCAIGGVKRTKRIKRSKH